MPAGPCGVTPLQLAAVQANSADLLVQLLTYVSRLWQAVAMAMSAHQPHAGDVRYIGVLYGTPGELVPDVRRLQALRRLVSVEGEAFTAAAAPTGAEGPLPAAAGPAVVSVVPKALPPSLLLGSGQQSPAPAEGATLPDQLAEGCEGRADDAGEVGVPAVAAPVGGSAAATPTATGAPFLEQLQVQEQERQQQEEQQQEPLLAGSAGGVVDTVGAEEASPKHAAAAPTAPAPAAAPGDSATAAATGGGHGVAPLNAHAVCCAELVVECQCEASGEQVGSGATSERSLDAWLPGAVGPAGFGSQDGPHALRACASSNDLASGALAASLSRSSDPDSLGPGLSVRSDDGVGSLALLRSGRVGAPSARLSLPARSSARQQLRNPGPASASAGSPRKASSSSSVPPEERHNIVYGNQGRPRAPKALLRTCRRAWSPPALTRARTD